MSEQDDAYLEAMTVDTVQQLKADLDRAVEALRRIDAEGAFCSCCGIAREALAEVGRERGYSGSIDPDDVDPTGVINKNPNTLPDPERER